MKEGNNNRFREQDIRKMTDVFNGQLEITGFAEWFHLPKLKKTNLT